MASTRAGPNSQPAEITSAGSAPAGGRIPHARLAVPASRLQTSRVRAETVARPCRRQNVVPAQTMPPALHVQHQQYVQARALTGSRDFFRHLINATTSAKGHGQPGFTAASCPYTDGSRGRTRLMPADRSHRRSAQFARRVAPGPCVPPPP